MPDIYLIRTDAVRGSEKLYPPERQNRLENTKSEKLKAQRAASWQALMSGISLSFGTDPRTLDFSMGKNGAWSCSSDDIFFSLSHSGEYAAAVVSSYPVGLDIEQPKGSRAQDAALLDRISTDAEKAIYSPADLPLLWTKKESIFKYSGAEHFSPSLIEASAFPVQSFRCCGLVISVCCAGSAPCRFFELHGEKATPVDAEKI